MDNINHDLQTDSLVLVQSKLQPPGSNRKPSVPKITVPRVVAETTWPVNLSIDDNCNSHK